MCFPWVFGAGELTLLILSARGGKLWGNFWVCFLGCLCCPAPSETHWKEMEGEDTPEAELCSVTAPLPTSLPREANAPSASRGRTDAAGSLSPAHPAQRCSWGGGTSKDSTNSESKSPQPMQKVHYPSPQTLLLLFPIGFFLSTTVISWCEDLFLV